MAQSSYEVTVAIHFEKKDANSIQESLIKSKRPWTPNCGAIAIFELAGLQSSRTRAIQPFLPIDYDDGYLSEQKSVSLKYKINIVKGDKVASDSCSLDYVRADVEDERGGKLRLRMIPTGLLVLKKILSQIFLLLIYSESNRSMNDAAAFTTA